MGHPRISNTNTLHRETHGVLSGEKEAQQQRDLNVHATIQQTAVRWTQQNLTNYSLFSPSALNSPLITWVHVNCSEVNTTECHNCSLLSPSALNSPLITWVYVSCWARVWRLSQCFKTNTRWWLNGFMLHLANISDIQWIFFFRILPVARYQFPHFQTWLHSTESLDHTVQNQPGSDLVLAACVRFWPDRAGLEASQCARIIRLATDQSELDVNQIWRAYWVVLCNAIHSSPLNAPILSWQWETNSLFSANTAVLSLCFTPFCQQQECCFSLCFTAFQQLQECLFLSLLHSFLATTVMLVSWVRNKHYCCCQKGVKQTEKQASLLSGNNRNACFSLCFTPFWQQQ